MDSRGARRAARSERRGKGFPSPPLPSRVRTPRRPPPPEPSYGRPDLPLPFWSKAPPPSSSSACQRRRRPTVQRRWMERGHFSLPLFRPVSRRRATATVTVHSSPLPLLAAPFVPPSPSAFHPSQRRRGASVRPDGEIRLARGGRRACSRGIFLQCRLLQSQ